MPRPRTLRSPLILTVWLGCAVSMGLAQPVTKADTSAHVTGEQHDSEAITGILLLRNGNVLEGKIQRQSDFYKIEMPKGELQVPVGQVDIFCHNLDEAYEQRRVQQTGGSADTHIDLARWCLRHELLEHAARELLDASSIDPDHRQLPLLERQLQLALQNRTHKHQPKPLVDLKAIPTDEQLESFEKVPTWARTLFVRQIQPLLVDSCATSGCHQPGSSESFHLNRLVRDGPGHPAVTMSNLAATLEQLDLKSPANSSLLERAKTAHGAIGTLPPQVLEPHQLQMLRTWVEQLALAQSNTVVKGVKLVSHQTVGSVDALPLIRQALDESEQQQVDPFDPERFNSRFASGENTSRDSSAAAGE